MEIKTVSPRMQSLVTLYDMHTEYFSKAIDGISENDAHNRLNTKANHIAWIAGSLVHERFELAGTLGTEIQQNTGELFENHKGIQEDVTYPTLKEYLEDWKIISPVLRNEYCNISDEKLDSTFTMPEMSMTYYELISFMTYREATCIGQIALWRRLLGLDAMKYM